MLSALKSLFAHKDDSGKTDPAKSEGDIQTAYAALLVEAARIDENYEEQEKNLIAGLLQRQFQLDEQAATQLREAAEAAQKEALDLHQFTKEVKTLPEQNRIDFIEGLWRIILSDGVRDPFEDALVRRLCGLIHVSDRASGEARQRVEK